MWKFCYELVNTHDNLVYNKLKEINGFIGFLLFSLKIVCLFCTITYVDAYLNYALANKVYDENILPSKYLVIIGVLFHVILYSSKIYLKVKSKKNV